MYILEAVTERRVKNVRYGMHRNDNVNIIVSTTSKRWIEKKQLEKIRLSVDPVSKTLDLSLKYGFEKEKNEI